MKKHANRWLLITARVYDMFTEEDAYGNRRAASVFAFLPLLLVAIITAVVMEVYYT
jgi:hypothetical protein